MSDATTLEPITTVTAYLRPIDGDGLATFAAKGKANPGSRGTNKVHTVMEGQYRSLSHVGEKHVVVVDEPLHLFGQAGSGSLAYYMGQVTVEAASGDAPIDVTFALAQTPPAVTLARLNVEFRI